MNYHLHSLNFEPHLRVSAKVLSQKVKVALFVSCQLVVARQSKTRTPLSLLQSAPTMALKYQTLLPAFFMK